MRRRFLALIPLVACSVQAPAMELGVNTHFEQNWPLSAFTQVSESGARGIRDVISWGKVERVAGRYDFTPANSGFASEACNRRLPLLLMLNPRNPIHDNGETVFSPEGRRAFADFVVALANRFPCLAAVEIGNEINGGSLTGRMTRDMPGSYIALLAALRPALKARHPDVALLAGSTLPVATGFLDRLFKAGLLPLVDGVTVHPYLMPPEQLPLHLARLRAAMARTGTSRPIWASEFGFEYASPDDAPPHALKMITLLSADHVARADWYALREERWLPNMGLYAGAEPRPAADSFRVAQTMLLPRGDAVRIDTGDPLVRIYRFGPDRYVAWGAGRAIRWNNAAGAWNARGQAIPIPTVLGEAPMIVDAPGGFSLGPASVVADSLLDFGGSGWRYAMVAGNGRSVSLDWIDWKWASYIGANGAPNFRAMPIAIALNGRPGSPMALIERARLPSAGSLWLSVCFEAAAARPVQVTISAGGQPVLSRTVTGTQRIEPLQIPSGGDLEIRYSGTIDGPSTLRRRVRVTRTAEPAPAQCLPVKSAMDADKGA